LEALACGLEVEGHEDKDRQWVIDNYGMEATTKRFLELLSMLKAGEEEGKQ